VTTMSMMTAVVVVLAMTSTTLKKTWSRKYIGVVVTIFRNLFRNISINFGSFVGFIPEHELLYPGTYPSVL
jgi:hypothetical protein